MRASLAALLRDPSRAVEEQEKTIECVLMLCLVFEEEFY